ncbi:MAG: hypothetical protein KBC18_00675 [Candidatus Saccharicenans sp.]|nr:hypothetical protein [Candidatus Saccharicenans sp.]
MAGKKLETFLEQAAAVAQDFFPAGSPVLIPILYSSIVWAVKRKGDLETEVSGLKLWLEPEIVNNKPDEFILDFFKGDQALAETFNLELKNGEIKSLRQAFRALYPVKGLEEPFLQSLFSEELTKGDYRQIAAQFDRRLRLALDEIKAAGDRPEWWPALKKIGENFLSLGWALTAEPELRARLKASLEKNKQTEDEE